MEVCHRGSLFFLAISVQFVALSHMRTSQCNRTCKDCDGCHECIGIYTSALVHCRQPPATQMLSSSLLLRSELNLVPRPLPRSYLTSNLTFLHHNEKKYCIEGLELLCIRPKLYVYISHRTCTVVDITKKTSTMSQYKQIQTEDMPYSGQV